MCSSKLILHEPATDDCNQHLLIKMSGRLGCREAIGNLNVFESYYNMVVVVV